MKKVLKLTGIVVLILMFCIGCSKDSVKKDSDSKSSAIVEDSSKGSESNGENKQKEDSTDSANRNKDNDEEEYTSQYAEANYFNKQYALVDSFVYYNNGKTYEFKADSKEGKEIYKLLKKRFANQGEFVTKDVTLKDKVEDIKTKGKALEVKFNKEYLYGTEKHKNTDYKSIAIYLY